MSLNLVGVFIGLCGKQKFCSKRRLKHGLRTWLFPILDGNKSGADEHFTPTTDVMFSC